MEMDEDIDYLDGMEEDNNINAVNDADPIKDINAFKNIVVDLLEKNDLS
jgi:hypothetical protein